MATSLRRNIPRHFLHLSPITTSLPPTFLLPLRAKLSTTTHTTDPEPLPSAYKPTSSPPPPPAASKHHDFTSHQQPTPPKPPATNNDKTKPPTQSLLTRSLLPPTPLPSTSSIPPLLPLLASQPPHFITAHLHSCPYLLTLGDTLKLPFHMPLAPPGTLLRLNRASVLGSRDYTLRGDPWVDERWFVCRCRVVGVETEPMRVEEKTKRRCRRVKRVRSKMRFTVLRVVEVGVRVPEGGEVGLASEEEGVGAGKGRVRKGKRGGDGGRKRVGGVERKTRWKSLDLAFATQAAGEEVENTVSRSVDLGSRRFKEEVADGEH